MIKLRLMAVTSSVVVSEDQLVNLFLGLDEDQSYFAQLKPGSPEVYVYQTSSSTAPSPRSIEADEGTAHGTIFPGPAGSVELIPRASSYLWAWTKPGCGNALLAITEV